MDCLVGIAHHGRYGGKCPPYSLRAMRAGQRRKQHPDDGTLLMLTGKIIAKFAITTTQRVFHMVQQRGDLNPDSRSIIVIPACFWPGSSDSRHSMPALLQASCLSALWAELRAFKVAPGDFVAGKANLFQTAVYGGVES